MPVPGYDPASYGPRRVVKFKLTRTALARRGTWTSAGRGWGGSAGGARMGSGRGGPAKYPSTEPRMEKWDARTLALHDALFELAMNAWDSNVRIHACVAMLDRLCGKPQPMTVTGQDPEAAPPGVVYVPLKAGD